MCGYWRTCSRQFSAGSRSVVICHLKTSEPVSATNRLASHIGGSRCNMIWWIVTIVTWTNKITIIKPFVTVRDGDVHLDRELIIKTTHGVRQIASIAAIINFITSLPSTYSTMRNWRRTDQLHIVVQTRSPKAALASYWILNPVQNVYVLNVLLCMPHIGQCHSYLSDFVRPAVTVMIIPVFA